ncbi:hypothetical protein COJ77_22145 [Bacillus cereus]|nr:hypothetical protein COJ77_22145 [Bacillus cereus]
MHKYSEFDEEASFYNWLFYYLLFPYLGVLYQPESVFCNAESNSFGAEEPNCAWSLGVNLS